MALLHVQNKVHLTCLVSRCTLATTVALISSVGAVVSLRVRHAVQVA